MPCSARTLREKLLAQVVHRQRQRVVGALFTAENLDALPGLHRLLGNTAHGAVPVVEQGTEQRRRRGHATATLSQGQGRMLVAKQRGEPPVNRLDPDLYPLPAHGDPQRQGIDKHPQRPVGTLAALHPAHQHGTEYHILFARDLAQYLSPGQVMQARGADSQPPGQSPQPLAQGRWQNRTDLVDQMTVDLNIAQAEWQGRLIDIAEHVAKEMLVFGLAVPQARLGHIVAVRHRAAQLFGLPQQIRLDFMTDHLQSGMVQGHVMEAQHRHPTLLALILGKHQLHQWGLGHVQLRVTGIEALLELAQCLTGMRVQLQSLTVQPRLAPDDLDRFVEVLPEYGRCAGCHDGR